MKSSQPNSGKRSHRTIIMAVLAATLFIISGCSAMMTHLTGVKKPPVSDFGQGPRTSDAGRYTAVLESEEPLRPRRMQTVEVVIRDAAGAPVDDATIEIDGGMPQHGHGLPTRPRVTRNLGDGRYRIDGVRFNMGGWWELKLAIARGSSPDTVTFNLAL
jgi:hypothetical protein